MQVLQQPRKKVWESSSAQGSGGLERGGVPSSPFRMRRDKLRRRKRTFSKKGFFPSSSNNLYWEQSFEKNHGKSRNRLSRRYSGRKSVKE